MATILQFPIKNIRSDHSEISESDREARLLAEKIVNIENALEYSSTEAIGMVHRLGFNITEENLLKDVTLVVDSIRSLMYRASKLSHPMHEYVDKNYILEDSEDGEYAYNPSFIPAKDPESEE